MRNRKYMKRTGAIVLTAVMLSSTGCGLVSKDAGMQEIINIISNGTASKTDPSAPAGKTGEVYVLEESMAEGYADMSAPGFYMSSNMSAPDWNTEEYSYIRENGWMSASASPFSTFAADVDTASYANVRRMLLDDLDVPEDAVRIEELINYFHYSYEGPKEGEPFGVTTQIAPCPWDEETKLLLVGLATEKVNKEEMPPSNLVFLIDTSGSMDDPDKLPLVQQSFRLLAETLGEEDRISIVTYAGDDTVVLEGTHGDEQNEIIEAIEDLMAGGGTNGASGIETAYRLAEENFIEGGNNRVILATDGDFNIGISDEGSLTRLIEEKVRGGVFLSVLGFGWGNISDTNMEALADHGNGNYHYIDSKSEARKVLIEEAGGNLLTVAKDVKLQVEFNPAMVKGYRQIGYENRQMAAEDFADDTKDGGEIGAGHQVTVLYEIVPADSEKKIPQVSSRYQKTEEATEGTEEAGTAAEQAGEWLNVSIRYKEPTGDTSKLLEYPVGSENITETMSDDLSWAAGVAQAGMILRNSEYVGTTQLSEVKSRMRKLADADPEHEDQRDEFVYLLGRIENAEEN